MQEPQLTPAQIAMLEQFEIEPVKNEGKQTVPEETTPPTEPKKKKKNNTAAGDSSSADTSLGSPELNRQQKFQEIEAEINATSIDDLRKTYNITDIEIEDFQYFYPNKSVDDYIRQTALSQAKNNFKNEEPQAVQDNIVQQNQKVKALVVRYAVVDGSEINESYYNKNLAGTKGAGGSRYPKTFDKYIKQLNYRKKKGDKIQILEKTLGATIPTEVIESQAEFPNMLEEVEVAANIYDPSSPASANKVNLTQRANEFFETVNAVNEETSKLSIALLHLGYVETDDDIARYLSAEDYQRYKELERSGETMYVPASYKEELDSQPFLSEFHRTHYVLPPVVWEGTKDPNAPDLFYDVLNNVSSMDNVPLRTGDGAMEDVWITGDVRLLTKSQILEGYDVSWAPDEIRGQGIANDKNKAAQLFLGDLPDYERTKVIEKIAGSIKGPLGEQYRAALNEKRISGAAQLQDMGGTMGAFSKVVAKYALLDQDEINAILADENKIIDFEVNALGENAKELENKIAAWEEANAALLQKKSDYETLIERKKETLRAAPLMPKGFFDPETVNAKYQKELELYNQDIEELNSLIDEYVSFLESDETIAVIENGKNLQAEANELGKQEDILMERIKTATDASVVFDAVVKNYSDMSRLLLGLEESFLGSGAAILETFSGSFLPENSPFLEDIKEINERYSNGQIGFGGWDNAMLSLNYNMRDYRHSLEKKRENTAYTRNYEEAVEAGTVAEYYWDSIINTVPTFAAIFLPQARASRLAKRSIAKSSKRLSKADKAVEFKKYQKLAQRQTMATFAYMEGGGYAMQTFGSIDRAKARNEEIAAEIEAIRNSDRAEDPASLERIAKLEKEYEYNEGLLDLDLLDITAGMISYASIATIAERAGTLRTMQKLSAGARSFGYRTFRKYLSQPISKWAANIAGNVKMFAGAVAIEEIEESITKIGQNGWDNMVGLETHITEGLDAEFFRQTAISSFVLNAKAMGPRIINSVRSTFANIKEKRNLEQTVKKIGDLSEKINELSNRDDASENVDQIRELQQKKDILLKELLREDVNIFSKLENLTDEDLLTIAKADLEIQRLQEEAGQIVGDAQRSEDAESELNTIKLKIDEQVQIREGLLNKSDKKIKELSKGAQNGAEAEFQLTQLEYSRAFARATMGDDYTEINSIQDLNKDNYSEKELAEIEKRIKRGDAAYYNNGKTILFLENAQKYITENGGFAGMIAATAPMHEFGHREIAKAGIVTDKGLVGIGDGLIASVLEQVEFLKDSKQINEKLYNTIIARINKYKELNKGQHDAEELITLITDLRGNNVITRSGFKQIWQIKSFINGVIKRANPKAAPYFKLDSYEDALNFVEHTIDKFKTGKQVAMLPEDELSTEGRASMALLDEINSLVPESVETQEQFFDRKVFNPIYNDGNLHPAIANYIRSRSVSQEEANKIIESVADRLVSFNPAAKRKVGDAKITFGEFLFSNVNFGKLDARKALFEESQERARLESTDSEQARQIIATETTTTSQQEMPEYKNLVERKVLSEEGFAAVGKIVQRTARTLKTRMDQAVSKNVTIKPYIAEIKKTIGKQADIIFKKEMGGLKDGELRKYLLKNKRAILENMTTTYLMTAMPNAVQKKVNGAWTSDWQGKKIDRETVSTDNAGRTSGAEMVRRLPNASTRLSDADFLSNFFTEDGKLIRGRKESLAKAMAEETAFDILNQELLDPNSDIREAFEQRQEELSAVLLDNFVANVRRDVERGNAKASLGFDITNDGDVKRFKNLVKEVDKYGIDNVVDAKGNLLPGYEEYNDLEGVGELVRLAHEAGAIIDPDGLKYMQRVQRSRLIPAGIKKFFAENKSLGKRSDKARLDRFDRERLVIAEALGGNILTALDPSKNKTGNEVSILGSHYRVLDPAQKKKDGSKGAYRDSHVKMLASPNKPLPAGLVLEDVVLFNSSFGLMAEIHAILNSNMLASQKLEELKQYEDKIRKANIANIKLYKHIATTIRDLYKSGQISGETVVELFQMQADLAAGFRALSSFSYITVTDGPLGKAKGEHLGDNATTSFKIMERMFDDFMTDAEFQARMDLDLRTHDQWLANATVTKAVDAYGVNNPSADMRIKFTGKRVNDVFTFDGKRASEVIDARMESLKQYEAFINGLDFAELDQAKQDILDVESAGKASIGVPRAVFMVGGPGAGKTNVGKGLKLGRRGFKVINQDIALEPMKEQAGLPANEQQYNKEQRSIRAKLGAAARKAAEQKMSQYMEGKKSMVVDGTGASYNATMKKINALREAGYEVSIVFANTSKEEAVARNKARAERALPDMIVERTWDAVQESAKLYKEEFGDRFYELNTNELKMGQELPTEFLNKLYDDLDVPVGKASIQVDQEFNEIIQRKTRVDAVKTYSRIQAQIRGRNKGRFKFFIAPGADDFRGLVHYAFSGKGKQGEADMAWFEEKLMVPYFKGIAAIDAMRQQIKRDFAVVKKQFRPQYKMLSKKIGNSQFTYDHALRVFMWDRQGVEIEGLAKRDKRLLLDAIAQNKELVELADALLVVGRRDEWIAPAEYWEAGSVLSDLNGMTEKVGRKKFLEEFIANAEIIFSEKNLNKIEALYGRRHREALEDSLYAMKNGTNRPTGSNRQVNAWLNWINGSTGAIMFFNRRSALLQMLSFTNFINWSDNNILKAGAAFANQKQYWSDWVMIFNSDKLKERRGGLKQDVSESEIAAVAGRSKNSPQAILAYLLKIGFTPTQIADSMAIATGGATFYRNRVNRYLKQGLSQKEAEEQAFLDFSMKSDEAQQSSDPALVSQQQRSVLGRLVLAFANTPMQYTRLMKKAGQDLINGRGRPIENISKIAYYGVIQNFIFSALQSAMFSMFFDDDDEEEELSEAEVERKAAKEEQKTIRVVNSMLDTVLRGSGVYGAVASTIKNAIMEYHKQEEKGFMGDHTYTLLAAAGISPPIQSKFRKIYSAIQTSRFEKDNVEARGWALTADGKLNLGPNWSIFGNVLSGVTNVPLDRVVDEMRSIAEALDERNQAWQRIALALGWKTWDVGVRNEEADLIKAAAKERRKEEGVKKAKETRAKTSEEKRKKEAAARRTLTFE